MSIQQEEILFKEFTSGTTLMFFSTHLSAIEEIPEITYTPTVIWLNDYDIPIKATTFDGQNIWTLNSENNYVPIETLSNNYVTGHSFTENYSFIIDDDDLAPRRERFSQQIEDALNAGSTIVTSEDSVSNPNPTITPTHVDYIFSQLQEVDDFFVNIKLNRTFGTLDTLNIYNNLVNSIPTQEANTGVVFGRLFALQTIKDSEGNNIKIPLRNVPIGIFNTSEDYPSPSSVSDNGDRIFLNIKESSRENEYFNSESFDFDTNKLLRSGSRFTSVPEQYKYVTTTNDEGEFIIYDAPIGTQIVMFEVDLLKQGLTRDEIALNFFPFPPDDDAILDQIPNFAFKQFPIDVVPAWGTIQTGYTELNVTVNMDLRKWTTYIFPPVAVGPQNLEAAVAENALNSVKIEVRNMAKEGYPKSEIKLAEIPNDLDRVFGQQYNWHLEIAQIKNKAEFYKFGCPVIKLPANIYDPKGFKTNSDGIPTADKGVWLSAYQLNIYSNREVNRKTGSIYAWNGSAFYTKSHFDLNFSPSVPDTSPEPDPGLGVGEYPYEKPWSVDYPNKYSIPRKPTDERYRYSVNRTQTSTSDVYYLDEPAYNDGDLVGYEVDDGFGNVAGGFGSQVTDNTWITNRISQVATRNFMYKYESRVSWNEEYANGYQPSNPGYKFAGVSSVVGGEKYQRFESGYGYFLKPSGWPRVSRTSWGADTYFRPDITGGVGLGAGESPGPGVTPATQSGDLLASESHINDVYNLKKTNLALALDSKARIKKGTLEAYRIVNSNPSNLNSPAPFVLPTYVKLTDGGSPSRCQSFAIKNTGDIEIKFGQACRGDGKVITLAENDMIFNHFIIDSNGVSLDGLNIIGDELVSPGEEVILKPGQIFFISNLIESVFSPAGVQTANKVGWVIYTLPGNSSFNVITNRYDVAKYELSIHYTFPFVSGTSQPIKRVPLVATALTSPQTLYLKTQHSGGSGRISFGMNTDFGGNSNAEIFKALIETNKNGRDL